MQVSTDSKVITLALPGPDIANDAQRFLESAKQYRINSDFMLEAATEDLKTVKAKYNALEEQRFGITRPLDEAKDGVMALFRPAKEFLAEAERILKLAISSYLQEQGELRAKAEAKAREQTRIEQERLAKEAAERERVAREESERLAKEAEAQSKAGNVTAASELKLQSDFVSMSGQQEAQDLVDRAANVVVQVDAPPPTKVAGITGTETWSAEVVDLMELVKAIAEGKAPLKCVAADTKVLNQMARALHNELAIPGVKAKMERGISAKASK